MRTLTPQELRSYDRDGFVIIPDVFPNQELGVVDQEMDRLLPEAGSKDAEHGGWILRLGLRSETTSRFAEDERLLSLIEDIVQPGIAIYSAKLTTKQPHDPAVCLWHQDDAFYFREPEDNSATRMSVWVPLQDVDEANGCMWVVPGSHRWGLQRWHLAEHGQCRRELLAEEADLAKAIPVPMPAGGVLLFSALLWHHSKGNQTDHIRRAFIVSYQEATVPRGNGEQWKILRPALLQTAVS